MKIISCDCYKDSENKTYDIYLNISDTFNIVETEWDNCRVEDTNVIAKGAVFCPRCGKKIEVEE